MTIDLGVVGFVGIIVLVVIVIWATFCKWSEEHG